MQETAQVALLRGVLVHQVGELLVRFLIARLCGCLDGCDCKRVPRMLFTFTPPGVQALVREFFALRFTVSKVVPTNGFFGHEFQANTFDAAGGSHKRFLDDVVVQTDSLKDLRAFVGLEG